MAEENKVSYTKIGLAVFLGIVLVTLAIVYLGGVGGGRDIVYGETYFVKSVSGLSVGSVVNFRGVKVGEVAEIGFVGDAYDVEGATRHMIRVKMAFKRRKLGFSAQDEMTTEEIRQKIEEMSLRATVTASGVTGLSRIEIDIRPDIAPLAITWTPEFFYIPPAASLLDSFSDAATKVMNQINKMDVSALWSNVSASVEALAKSTEGVQALIETRRNDIDKIASDLSETMSALRDFSEAVRQNPSLLLRDRTRAPLDETRRDD